MEKGCPLILAEKVLGIFCSFRTENCNLEKSRNCQFKERLLKDLIDRIPPLPSFCPLLLIKGFLGNCDIPSLRKKVEPPCWEEDLENPGELICRARKFFSKEIIEQEIGLRVG